MTPKAAMVFAAGFGTRMGQLTVSTPKPMLHLDARPMIDHTIRLLKEAGVQTIVANTHHLAHVLEPHLSAQGVKISHEARILETGGGLKAALPLLASDPVATINPDAAWFGTNPVSLISKSWRTDMTGLLLCVRANGNGDFDIVDGRIKRGGVSRYTGVQILRVDR